MKLPVMVICLKEGFPGVRGSYHRCKTCRNKIFVSDSSLDSAMKQGDDVELTAYCIPCGVRKINEDNPQMADLTSTQMEEIRNGIK